MPQAQVIVTMDFDGEGRARECHVDSSAPGAIAVLSLLHAGMKSVIEDMAREEAQAKEDAPAKPQLWVPGRA